MSQDADIAVVVKEMLLHRRRCVPIIDGAKLVGVITRRDAVRLLARSDRDIANDVCKHLVYLGGHVRWQVTVVDGEATLGDRYDDATDRFVAVTLAEAVPGVLRATAVKPTGDRHCRSWSVHVFEIVEIVVPLRLLPNLRGASS